MVFVGVGVGFTRKERLVKVPGHPDDCGCDFCRSPWVYAARWDGTIVNLAAYLAGKEAPSPAGCVEHPITEYKRGKPVRPRGGWK